MFKKKRLVFFTLLSALLLSSGCVDNKTAPASDVPDKVISVSVSPSPISLPTGGTQQFSASVSGTNNAAEDVGNTAVTWRLEEGGAGGLISSTGLYTAPSNTGTFHVIATSVLDPKKTNSVTVTVSSILDASFGTGGSVSTGFGGLDVINALKVQDDGKIVAGGSSIDGKRTRFALARYNVDGSLDTSFGTSGIVTTLLGPSSEINGLALQTDGKIVAVGATSNINDSDFAIARYNSDGSLDTSFGPDANGMMTTGVSTFEESGSTPTNESDQANAVDIQADGKIVVGGSTEFSILTDTAGNSSSHTDFALVRYTSDGSLDTTFDSNGIVFSQLNDDLLQGEIKALKVQSDGKIVAAGRRTNGINSAGDFILVRYTSSGTQDPTFGSTGTDGYVSTPVLSGDDQVRALILQADGNIVAGGYAHDGIANNFALVRYEANGNLDTSFDTDGKVTEDIATNNNDEITALLLQSDGSILAAGFINNGTANNFTLARFTSSGTLDSSFGTSGITTTALTGGASTIQSMAFSDTNIVVGGITQTGTQTHFALARYDENGTLDTAFDSDGSVTTSLGAGSDEVTALLIQDDGKIIAGGTAFAANSRMNEDFALARYNTDGALDTEFGSDGQVSEFFQTGTNPGQDAEDIDKLQALALQPDGKIIAGGFSYISSANKNDFALARYDSDGNLDTSFGTDATGRVTTAIGSGQDEIQTLIVLNNDKILAAGTAFITDQTDFALVRYNADGTLDTTFDTDGMLTTSVGSGSSKLEDMVVQSDDKILLLGTADNGSDLDVALVRYNSDGTLDTDFDKDGIVTTAIGTQHDAATAIALQTDGKILVAATALTGGTTEAFTIIRYNSDGSLDTGFGTAGFTSVSIGLSSNAPLAIALQADGKILAAGYSLNPVNSRDFTLVRFLSDGTLDTGFATNGIEITPFSRGIDQITALAIQSDGGIVAAGFSTRANSDATDFHIARYLP